MQSEGHDIQFPKDDDPNMACLNYKLICTIHELNASL